MNRIPKLARLALTAAVAVALSSCSTAASPLLESSDGHLVVVSVYDSTGVNQALFTGSLAWGDGGCIVTAEGQDLIVFPKGTTIDENDEIVLPNGFHIRAGDEVGLGGGFTAPDATSETLAEVPDGCLTDEIFYASGEVAE